MIKYRSHLIIFLFFLSNFSFGQDYIDPKLCIESNLLPLLGIDDCSSYRVGAELKIHNNISAYVEGGGYFSGVSGLQIPFNAKGYIAKAEIKLYLNRDKVCYGNYLSIEGVYKKQSYDWTDTIKLVPQYIKTFRMSKNVECLDVKYGYLASFKSGIIIDVYTGIGIRFKDVSSTLSPQEYNSVTFGKYEDYGDTFYENVIGKLSCFNITMGIKIGYRIK
jgi:hypothetical protein